MSRTFAIVLAGGKGLRLGGDIPKQFLPLGDRPVILRTIDIFHSLECIEGIIAVLPGDYIGTFKNELGRFKYQKPIKVVEGGDTRQKSAYNALNASDFNNEDILIFHDAARPFVKKETVINLINGVEETGAAGTYVNVIDTITEIRNDLVESIPDRNLLYSAQTPQGFRYRIIKRAHDNARDAGLVDATDDVSLVLRMGVKVKAVFGDYDNFKITTENDYRRALQLHSNVF
jgi:2-C-methyl-D-erythritol 4-phosphate cytidylyltransferase